MIITIKLSGVKPKDKKEVINSIRGVVKAMAKRVGMIICREIMSILVRLNIQKAVVVD